MTNTKTLSLFAIILLIAQFFFWYGMRFDYSPNSKPIWVGSKSVKPELEIVPAAPSKEMLKAFAFGDEQLVFRYNGSMMQFLGDTFGRVTPLKDYNFERLYRWWMLLDDVDPHSDLITYVAGYYYASTQNPEEQIKYVVDFLEYHSDKDPVKNWWWYSQAFYNAKHKMKDNERALKIAEKLEKLPKDMNIPIWTRQLRAFLYEDMGEYKQACDMAVNVIRDYGENKLTEGELNFMYSFVQERIRTLVQKESTLDKADISPECRVLMEVQKAQDLKAASKELNN